MATDHAGSGEPTLADVRRALVDVDCSLRNSPTAVQQRYKNIDEAELRTWTEHVLASLDEGTLAWLDRDPLEAAAAQARGLDRYLFQHREIRGKPDDVNSDHLCVERDVHVIPRPLATTPHDPARIGTPTYRRRGLVWHRLIPLLTCDGYRVRLEWHRDLSLSFRHADAQVVSALFPGLHLVPDQRFSKFVAGEAPCADEVAAIRVQVKQAYLPGTVLALWPELTMPDHRRTALASALLAMSAEAALGQGPAVVAAGSWHEVNGAVVRNRMYVMSRSGRTCFSHDKSLPLQSATLGVEELTPSYEVPVLVSEDALIAFAICRDFCENQISNVYHELDVDLVVVPSYGDGKTIEAHRQKARDLSDGPGTRTFVVQQAIPEEGAASGLGYVLAPTQDPHAIDAPSMATNAPARSHALSFKRT